MLSASGSACDRFTPAVRLVITPWVTPRLPAASSATTRSPGSSKRNIFLKRAILSTPALVRVSERRTKPALSLRPTQYVMSVPILRRRNRSLLLVLIRSLDLSLRLRLADVDRGGKPLFRRAGHAAPDWSSIGAVDAAAKAHIAVRRTNPVGGIETNPADILHIRLRPGMRFGQL